jgi:hypothetical protein
MSSKVVNLKPPVFEPAITRVQAQTCEKNASAIAIGQERRVMLSTLVLSPDELVALARENPETFQEMREMVEAFKTHAASLAHFADAASARLQIVSNMAGSA